MSVPNKFEAGALFPSFDWPIVGGGTMNLAHLPGWRVLMVYRGKHCPLCKRYFKQLNEMLTDFAAAGLSMHAVSADPLDKARADVESEGWRFPVAYDMPLDDMRKLGLYISSPRSDSETDRPFAEPAMFVINPDDRVQSLQIGNASHTRADLGILLAGLPYTMNNKLPVRGTMA